MVRKTTGRTKASAAVTEDDLRRHIRAKGADYLKDPNITSVGIGLKNGNGAVCLQFTVGRKGESALESLSTTRIPEMIDIDGTAVPTDVIERSYGPSYNLVSPEQLDLRKQRIEPILPGVSVAHIAETAGTIGLIVFDRSTGSPCILSNWHVLNGNSGRVGDAIVQPGPYDDNNTALNGVGELMRSHIGAAGDCALARIRLRILIGLCTALMSFPSAWPGCLSVIRSSNQGERRPSPAASFVVSMSWPRSTTAYRPEIRRSAVSR